MLDLLAIGLVVEVTTRLNIPFAHIVPEQWFTMAGADDYAAGVGHRLNTRNLEKGCRARMHGWPNHVGAQAEKQLEDLLIGGRADMSFLARLKGLATPAA